MSFLADTHSTKCQHERYSGVRYLYIGNVLVFGNFILGLDKIHGILKKKRLDHDQRTVHVKQDLGKVLELENVCDKGNRPFRID